MHTVKIIIVTHSFLSLIVDILIKVIGNSMQITFLATHSESVITISLCFIGNNCFYRRIRMLDLENKSNITGRHVSIDS